VVHLEGEVGDQSLCLALGEVEEVVEEALWYEMFGAMSRALL